MQPALRPSLKQVLQRIRSIPVSCSMDFASRRQTTRLLAPAHLASVSRLTLLPLYRVAAPLSRLPQSFGFQIRPRPTSSGNPSSPANPSRPTGSRAVARGIFPRQFLHPPFSPALLLALP